MLFILKNEKVNFIYSLLETAKHNSTFNIREDLGHITIDIDFDSLVLSLEDGYVSEIWYEGEVLIPNEDMKYKITKLIKDD